jgi:hypothetical protein
MRAMEYRACNNGWECFSSDNTDNSALAKNFVRTGAGLYEPQNPWAWPHTLIGEGPSNDGVIVVEGNVRNVPERCVISKALHSAPWPFGHRVFFVPGTKMRSHCFLRLHALYDAEGASHDFVEQGFHDQDAGADHSCTGRHSHSEGGKSALRL